ncbi:hypothetical protein [Defluviimonas sp. SAOS-178_SWC]|uniref:hypothetical protein n=1 Tax=Defluviimonas sp. SAOS-178_SWC TaxID=3121287 RepID=UPI003221F715
MMLSKADFDEFLSSGHDRKAAARPVPGPASPGRAPEARRAFEPARDAGDGRNRPAVPGRCRAQVPDLRD